MTDFLSGYSIKPALTSTSGEVLYTDGTNSVKPNQDACEAYGYTYDKASGMCRAYAFSTKVPLSLIDETNYVQGANNTTEKGVNNTYVTGESNIVRGLSRNNMIVGSNNQIGILGDEGGGANNATVLGSRGLAQRDGEVVMGGGGDTIGKSQSSTIHLSGQTTDGGASFLSVSGDSSVTTIARDVSATATSFTGFEANVMGVRTGGTAAGNTNDRILLRATGIAYLKADNQSVSTLGSFGTVTGWTAAIGFSGTNDMNLQVTGATNMNITWSCTLNLYEMKV
jgi:hypothetical protein|tara:strand:- start:1138 stop:1983 length:846 start_codon:yes stop_codon:yes gene_type:complete